MKKFLVTPLLVLVAFFSVPAAASGQSSQSQLDQINQQITNINKTLENDKSQQNTIEGEVATINDQIQVIQLQLSATQYQINVINTNISQINQQIQVAQTQLDKEKVLLSEYLRTMYINGQVSTVELIAESKNFSDFVDRNEYLSTMQQNVQGAANKVLALTAELNQKKSDLETQMAKAQQLQASQEAQQAAIVAQQNYENSLLANVEASQQSLNQQKSNLYEQRASLSASFGETITQGTSGYPYGDPPPASLIDTPDAYGYSIGECTSYAAWWRYTHGDPVPRDLGNAKNWVSDADGTTPTVGSVMVFPDIAPYGHVAIVMAVNGDGTVLISEYNWVKYSYDERTVNPYNYNAVFIH